MEVVLPAPFTPTTMITAGGSATLRQRALGGFQDFEQVLADQAFELGGIAHQVARHALADALQDFRRGLAPMSAVISAYSSSFENVGCRFPCGR